MNQQRESPAVYWGNPPLSLLTSLLPFPSYLFQAKATMTPNPTFPSSLRPMLALFLLYLSLPCISFSITVLHSTAMDPQERETLFHVMEAMSSDRDWRSSNPDPCTPGSSWPGIECKPGSDSLLHVTRLDFGVAPNPTCKRTATFPTEVFTLPRLQSLFFLNCFKTTKTNLSMPPPRAEAFPSLEQLTIKSNPSLDGVIPPSISSLTSLQVLTLAQNHLTGTIPDGISQLSSLLHLDLSYNALTGRIPIQIGEIRKLIGLDVSYNFLSGNIPPSIGNLILLQKLDLSSNGLDGPISESIENLSSLAFLALSNNKLNGEFPKGIAKLQNLQYFIMDDNPMFVPLPPLLGSLAKLVELRLANSGYRGSIPVSFARLTNLNSLSLENNKLSGDIPAGLSGLSKIYHLNLSRNLLTGVVPFAVGFVRRLGRNLDLSGNPGLCFNGSDSLESLNLGVDLCGSGRSTFSTMQNRPLRSSGGPPCLPCKVYCHFLVPLLILCWLRSLF